MRKIFGKNQVVITALALMIAVAGYLSITQENSKTKPIDSASITEENDTYQLSESGDYIVSPEIVENDTADKTSDTTATDKDAGLSEDVADAGNTGVADNAADAKDQTDTGNTTDTNNTVDTNNTADTNKVTDANNTATTSDGKVIETAESENAGEAVLVSGTIGSKYFDQAKLSREQTHSKNKEILMELVNNQMATESQRDKAVSEVIELTENSEKETAAEAMLEAKGYGDCIVNIVDENCDVIVNAGNLNETDIAKIQDIIMRKTNIKADNIVITPVGVENNAVK